LVARAGRWFVLQSVTNTPTASVVGARAASDTMCQWASAYAVVPKLPPAISFHASGARAWHYPAGLNRSAFFFSMALPER
jgi:hypothetical protein